MKIEESHELSRKSIENQALMVSELQKMNQFFSIQEATATATAATRVTRATFAGKGWAKSCCTGCSAPGKALPLHLELGCQLLMEVGRQLLMEWHLQVEPWEDNQ